MIINRLLAILFLLIALAVPALTIYSFRSGFMDRAVFFVVMGCCGFCVAIALHALVTIWKQGP